MCEFRKNSKLVDLKAQTKIEMLYKYLSQIQNQFNWSEEKVSM